MARMREPVMKFRATSMSILALTLALPAQAQDQQAYVGLDGGLVFTEDFRTDIGTTRKASETTSATGWEYSAVLGYDWGHFRTEIEGSRRDWNVDSISAVAPGIPTTSTTPATGSFSYDGDFQITAAMANLLLDFGESDNLGFSVGAGAGRAWLDGQTSAGAGGPGHFDTSDSDWAWQGLAQIRLPVSDAVELGVKYRFFSSQEFVLTDTLGRRNEFELENHAILFGLRVNLGGNDTAPVAPRATPSRVERPEPPAPPVVTPPPPPAAVSCNSGPYIVFFDWDRADITPEAASVLNSAVSAYGNCGVSQVMLAGHADRSGSDRYNVALSERRNAAVRAYLTSRGIPAARMIGEAFGESMPRVATADGVRELQNRRVEVLYGPGSGM